MPYDLPSGRDSVGKNNLCIEEYEIYLICPHLKKKRHTSDACSTRATYDENLKIYRDWKATMEYAVEEAETKGKAEGERLATLRNARNMKKAGVDLSLIAECTGLSLEIIQSL